MATVGQGPRRRPGNILVPIILIVAGILLLLSNLGWLPPGFWATVLRLWPVILILIGLEIILSRYLGWGATATAIVLVAILILLIAAGVFASASGAWINWPIPGFGFGPTLAGSGNVVTQEKLPRFQWRVPSHLSRQPDYRQQEHIWRLGYDAEVANTAVPRSTEQFDLVSDKCYHPRAISAGQ